MRCAGFWTTFHPVRLSHTSQDVVLSWPPPTTCQWCHQSLCHPKKVCFQNVPLRGRIGCSGSSDKCLQRQLPCILCCHSLLEASKNNRHKIPSLKGMKGSDFLIAAFLKRVYKKSLQSQILLICVLFSSMWTTLRFNIQNTHVVGKYSLSNLLNNKFKIVLFNWS